MEPLFTVIPLHWSKNQNSMSTKIFADQFIFPFERLNDSTNTIGSGHTIGVSSKCKLGSFSCFSIEKNCRYLNISILGGFNISNQTRAFVDNFAINPRYEFEIGIVIFLYKEPKRNETRQMFSSIWLSPNMCTIVSETHLQSERAELSRQQPSRTVSLARIRPSFWK